MSYCLKCGTEVTGIFCSNCGQKVSGEDIHPSVHNVNLNIGRQPIPYKTNTYAILSLVLACISFIFGWCVLAIVAIVLGNTAKLQIQQRNEQGDKLATTGIILGWVNIGLSVFACIILFIICIGI